MSSTPVSARRIPGRLGERCCAPGCGDKIKPAEGDTMFEVTWSDGSLTYIEDAICASWFQNGHPDVGGGRGRVPGLGKR